MLGYRLRLEMRDFHALGCVIWGLQTAQMLLERGCMLYSPDTLTGAIFMHFGSVVV